MKDETSSEKPVQANEIVNKNPDSIVHLRKLTVSASYIPYQGRFMWGKGNIHPFLRLKGRWLEKAGFTVHSQVDVIMKDNLLIIRPAGM
ncbi:MAG: type I toxin-antitoxin system SymE family toxin [Bacteroides sp.]|nr:type I toxin-antitoxin system SymE family toxin [Bacteroides sp.]